jgi:hypothetical protein
MAAMLLCLVLAVADDAPPPSVAMVLHSSKVKLRRGKQKPRSLRDAAVLRPGDHLRAEAGGEAVVVFFKDGHRERLKPGREATVGGKGCTPAGAVERVSAARLSAPAQESLRTLAPSAGAALSGPRDAGDPASARPPRVTPLFGAAVLTGRPELSWPMVEKAEGYRVELLSGVERRPDRPLWQATTKEMRLTYPAKEKPLECGRVYRWQVRPLSGGVPGEPSLRSRFQVLTEEEAAELAGLKPLVDSKSADDWLLAAVLYEAHGVSDEVLRLCERLEKARPGQPAFPRILATYYERAGRPDLAEAARERAAKLEAGAGGG